MWIALAIIATIVLIILANRKGYKPSLGGMMSGNKKSFLIVVVALVVITALSWFVTQSTASFALLLLIPFHLWLTGRLMAKGGDPTWAGAMTITAGAVLGVMLWYSGWGLMLQNDVNYLNTEAKVKAEAGEGFFTGGDCPEGIRVPMDSSIVVPVSKNCEATLDVRGIPIKDRGVITDVEQVGAGTGKSTSDFAYVEYIYERGEMVGVKIKPHHGYKANDVTTMNFIVYWRQFKAS